MCIYEPIGRYENPDESYIVLPNVWMPDHLTPRDSNSISSHCTRNNDDDGRKASSVVTGVGSSKNEGIESSIANRVSPNK